MRIDDAYMRRWTGLPVPYMDTAEPKLVSCESNFISTELTQTIAVTTVNKKVHELNNMPKLAVDKY